MIKFQYKNRSVTVEHYHRHFCRTHSGRCPCNLADTSAGHTQVGVHATWAHATYSRCPFSVLWRELYHPCFISMDACEWNHGCVSTTGKGTQQAAGKDLSGARTTLPGEGVVVVVKRSRGRNQTKTESLDMTEKRGKDGEKAEFRREM